MQLSAERILHEAFVATLNYRGEYACVPQLLRDAERYLKGDVIAQPGEFARLFFYREYRYYSPSPSHTCMDFPTMQCPACSGFGLRTSE